MFSTLFASNTWLDKLFGDRRINAIRLFSVAGAACVFAIGSMPPGFASALRVEPVLVEVFAPGAASTLGLRNDDDSEVNVQIRVFKWSQSNGKETLEPTTDVVASPPVLKIAPRSDYVARIVRVAKSPVVAEESYRIVVDQLPQPQLKSLRQVNLLIRQSIPVFFAPHQRAKAAVGWSLAFDGQQLVVTAQNAGDRRLRISALTLRDGAGKTITFGNGLVGYVLHGSTRSWTAPGQAHGFGAGAPVAISAQTDSGPIYAAVSSVGR